MIDCSEQADGDLLGKIQRAKSSGRLNRGTAVIHSYVVTIQKTAKILTTGFAGPERAGAGRDPRNQVRKIMIKSYAQRERTVVRIEGFKQALAKVARDKPGKRSPAIRGSYEGMIRQLE